MKGERIVAKEGPDELVCVGAGFFSTYWHRHIESQVTYQTSTLVSRRAPMGYFDSDEEAMREWRRRIEQAKAKGYAARDGASRVPKGKRIPRR